MKTVYSDAHALHDPQHFLVRGKLRRTHERPERARRLLDAVAADGYPVLTPSDHGLAPIEAIHTRAYLQFLQTAHARWRELDDASDEVRPNIHPFPGQPVNYPESVIGQAGYHLGDGACPIGPRTWEAAHASAQVAAHAARLVVDGERAVYALCRPPGHHAYADRANGFCYLNNTAIAAQVLRQAHARVAILDIDVHHGNGTQGIFYRRRDVLTISLHRDTRDFTPFFTGHAHERGEADGEGYNLNLPLPRGTDDEAYLAALHGACERIRAFSPGALVVALGLDAHEHDPYQSLAITTTGFFRIAAEIGRLGLPTTLVQEGGYLSDSLGRNLSSALRGFLSTA
ncbi:histone deacetylase family protein [Burkholderia plantarii]|uniref:Putative acetylpolyamine aminohydrolase AphA n=1 Tax=Burkholderia plantarii TaxID=41899 RepID=A0A0B6SA16_BURPL|nr:histone deacetylase family protein [Burkholderia plantarii]AJK50130.1 putative acetylpolyamine aminohydrolase AphA [Burkholderia plantarii]